MWAPEEVAVVNTLGSLVAFYAFYDYFLHVRWLYVLLLFVNVSTLLRG